MIFRINNDIDRTFTELNVFVRSIANTRVWLFPMKRNELVLDQYLKDNYKIGLKQFCKQYIAHMKISKVASIADIVIINPNTYEDKIANLITYGNASMHGSTILVEALTQ